MSVLYRNLNESDKSHYKRFSRVYSNIVNRCNKPKTKNYKNYGGRGIRNEWVSFGHFKKDMWDSYITRVKLLGDNRKNTTLDRINNDGNYSKENCRWATMYEQAHNKRNPSGRTFLLSSIIYNYEINKYKLNYSTVTNRMYHRNCSVEQALSYPKIK